MRELHGALAFHSTTFSHLHTSHITIVSFPGPIVASKSYIELKCVGKKLVYQMYAGVHGLMEQYNLGMCSSWVHCTHSVSLLWNGSYCCRQQSLQAFGGGLKGCKDESSTS